MTRTGSLRRHVMGAIGFLLAALGPAPTAGQTAGILPARPDGAAARAAFDRLKGLAGTWEGPSADASTGAVFMPAARFEYQVTGGGSAVVEWANVGTADEMLSVFFLNGDRLVLQHYCSAANQPRMELIGAGEDSLFFDFVGGDNLDPSVDGHIHSVRFRFHPDGRLESLWSWYEEGEARHVNRRVAWRMEGE